jgi:hypothetical protein
MKGWINSFTIKELLDNRDGNFIHHDKYASELQSPVLEYCYCNTLKFKIKSSKFGKPAKAKNGIVGTNRTWYDVYILFEDFYTIGKDKDIPFEDAIDYAINFGDVHARCRCPAATYWGYNYQGTALHYLYGIPREDRYPIERNPGLKGTICKHVDVVLQWILRNKDLIAKMFAKYYERLKDGQSIYAVNANGTTITIGSKNGDGDVFVERQEEEMEPEEEMIEENGETPAEESNVVEGEEFDVEDPTAGGVDWEDEPEGE